MELGIVGQIGQGLLVQFLFMAVGLLGGLGVLIAWYQDREVAPGWFVLACTSVLGSGALIGTVEVALDWDPSDVEKMRLVAMTGASARLLAFLIGAPALALLFLGNAGLGARHGPRRWVPGAVVFVLVLGVAAVTVYGGHAIGDMRFTNLRAVVYVALGALVAVAQIGAASSPGARPPAVASAAVLPLFVAAGETARRGLVEILLVQGGLQALEHDLRQELVTNYVTHFSTELWWAGMTVAASAVINVGVVLWQAREADRWTFAPLAGTWLVAVMLLWAHGLSAVQLTDLAMALP